jgi:hypothetical protein
MHKRRNEKMGRDVSRVKPSVIISFCNHLIRSIQQSAEMIYAEIEHLLAGGSQKQIKTRGVTSSGKGESLQIARNRSGLHIYAAPIGNSFFVSWWLISVESGLLVPSAAISKVGPLVAAVFRLAAARIDTTLMFQGMTHAAVTTAIDAWFRGQDLLRQLSGYERKSVMRDLLAKRAPPHSLVARARPSLIWLAFGLLSAPRVLCVSPPERSVSPMERDIISVGENRGDQNVID